MAVIKLRSLEFENSKVSLTKRNVILSIDFIWPRVFLLLFDKESWRILLGPQSDLSSIL